MIKDTRSLHSVISLDKKPRSNFVIRLERSGLDFKPGEYVHLGLADQRDMREYSIYSASHDPYLEILFRLVPSGFLTPRLGALKRGDKIKIEGPMGRFVINPKERKKRMLFVATGTGISPFRSIIRSFKDLDYKVVYGVSFVDEIINLNDINTARYVSCVSRENKGDFYGRVTDYLKRQLIDGNTLCYICGNNHMIFEVYAILQKKGIPRENIFTEVYY